MERVAKRAGWAAAGFMAASFLFQGDGCSIVCAINSFTMTFLMVKCWE